MNDKFEIPISGFEGYTINGCGEVFSYKRKAKVKLKQHIKNNYLQVCIRKNNKAYHLIVSRLVALHFVFNSNTRETVNHKDFNKLNNHYSNLEWLTASENVKHYRDNRGIYSDRYKLSWELVEEIKTEKKLNKTTNKNLSLKYGVGMTIISNIINGKKWVR